MPAVVTSDHADAVAALPKNVVPPIPAIDNSPVETPSRTVQSNGGQSSLGSPPDEDDEFDYEALPENTSLAANLIAGAVAGIMEHTVMYPVDAIKTRMQVAKSANVYSGLSMPSPRSLPLRVPLVCGEASRPWSWVRVPRTPSILAFTKLSR